MQSVPFVKPTPVELVLELSYVKHVPLNALAATREYAKKDVLLPVKDVRRLYVLHVGEAMIVFIVICILVTLSA